MINKRDEETSFNMCDRKVVIGIVNKENKLLMIKRAKKEDELLWAFPGGKVEPGESKEEACIREILEETNVKVRIVKALGQRVHPNTNIEMTYFLCEYVEGEAKVVDSNEILEVAYKNRKEFFKDVKTDIFPPVLQYINGNIL